MREPGKGLVSAPQDRRGEGLLCIVNFGSQPLELPAVADVLVGSAELVGGTLSHDTKVWLVQATDRAASDPEPTRTQHSFLVRERSR